MTPAQHGLSKILSGHPRHVQLCWLAVRSTAAARAYQAGRRWSWRAPPGERPPAHQASSPSAPPASQALLTPQSHLQAAVTALVCGTDSSTYVHGLGEQASHVLRLLPRSYMPAFSAAMSMPLCSRTCSANSASCAASSATSHCTGRARPAWPAHKRAVSSAAPRFMSAACVVIDIVNHTAQEGIVLGAMR